MTFFEKSWNFLKSQPNIDLWDKVQTLVQSVYKLKKKLLGRLVSYHKLSKITYVQNPIGCYGHYILYMLFFDAIYK